MSSAWVWKHENYEKYVKKNSTNTKDLHVKLHAHPPLSSSRSLSKCQGLRLATQMSSESALVYEEYAYHNIDTVLKSWSEVTDKTDDINTYR